MKALFVSFASILLSVVKGDKIDDAIANAIMFPSSTFCNGAAADETTFSSVFESTGHWNPRNADYEEDAFNIEMTHTDKIDSNHTWSMRIGKGGQIVSLIGPYGEANANQGITNAPWTDLVTQLVAVNSQRNNKSPYEGYQNFIHGSGVYMKDEGMPPPFYNPMLAMNCEGNQCTLVNWGQQAHVPTVHRSDLIYYQRYRDCGEGIIEYDQVIHHFGSDTVADSTFDYLNTPWSNVRTSSLPQMMVSSTSGSLEEPQVINSFGAGNQVRNLDTTGGFTTFAQGPNQGSITSPYDPGFCIDTAQSLNLNVPCSTPDSVEFTLITQADDTAVESGYHTNFYGFTTVLMKLNNLGSGKRVLPGCSYCDIIVTNNRTGFSFLIKHVLHWVWAGEWLYFMPNVSAEVINKEFKTGDQFAMTKSEITRDEIFDFDGSALSFVHGISPEFEQTGNSFYKAKPRMRWGSTPLLRDGTVWTTNLQGNLNPQETYHNRKFLISGKFVDAASTASRFTDETLESINSMSQLNAEFSGGEIIQLHCNDDVFGSSIGNESCWTGATSVCSGSTVPKEGSTPLYYITCNGRTYVGGDAYNFIPELENGQLKPYICANEDISVRPTFKLLGFFNADECDNLSEKVYVENFCSAFTHVPSTSPVTTPTTVSPVSASPTDQPVSTSPTHAPISASPTKGPVSASPTDTPVSTNPTGAPISANPTVSPASATPTGAPITFLPTDTPVSAGPTNAPVSGIPTKAPASVTPTGAPVSGSPTESPTDAPVTVRPTVAPISIIPTRAPASIIPTSAPVSLRPTVLVNCPQAFSNNAKYAAGDEVTVENKIYKCKAYPQSQWCDMAGFQPGASTNWDMAWTRNGECSAEPPVGSPTCPPAFSTSKVYAANDKVSVNKKSIYKCKGYPQSQWCDMVGYEPETSLYWKEAWDLKGVCPDQPPPPTDKFIRFSHFSVKKNNKKGKIRPVLKFIARNQKNKKVDFRVVIAYSADGGATYKQKACNSNSNGLCFMKLPFFHPSQISYISVKLEKVKSKFGSINLDKNVKYNECPAFSNKCKEITITIS